MSSEPASLTALRALLKERTGLKANSLGIVGNAAHTCGYHLGEDRIFPKGGDKLGDADYSVQTKRDKNGLSNKASAIDIGSFKGFRRMSKFIVGEARANAADARDIREVIFSPDGKKVRRWDRQNGVDSEPQPNDSNISHRTHTHVSFYRDSEDRDKTALFARFFDGGPPTPMKKTKLKKKTKPKGEVVKSFSVPAVPSVCTVRIGVQLFVASDLKQIAFVVDPARDMPFLGEPFKGIALVHRTDEQDKPTGTAFFARMSDLTNIRPV